MHFTFIHIHKIIHLFFIQFQKLCYLIQFQIDYFNTILYKIFLLHYKLMNYNEVLNSIFKFNFKSKIFITFLK